MALNLLPGESRGYWKHHAPDKWFKQAKVHAKLNNEKAMLLFDTGAEVSIVDTTFARKVGCHIDDSKRQECVGIGEGSYLTDGRTRIKVTLGGSLVYFFDAWVGRLAGQDAILGMDFMVPAGVRLDMADGSVCLPEEVRLRLDGRRQLFSDRAHLVTAEGFLSIDPGGSVEVPLRVNRSEKQKLWVTRGEKWVPSIVQGPGQKRFLKITNVCDEKLRLGRLERLGLWLSGDHVPRLPGFVSEGSRRYKEWQNLAYEATQDSAKLDEPEVSEWVPSVSRREYVVPRGILSRPKHETPTVSSIVAPGQRIHIVNVGNSRELQDDYAEPASYYHEGSELFAEDIESQLAVLPKVASTTEEVKIEDLKVGDLAVNTPEEIDRLRAIIWEKKHLLIGKGNALPPAAKGAVCDIDVGGARPIAQRVRKIPPQFREKVAELLKGLLSAKIIRPSTSPWASPIVVVIKKNGVDIRLCIDYRLVNNLTRLMVYPMPLINDLLEDLEKVLWFCSLDMASGFWVVSMTERARAISAFVTPFGLFEWNRMPFGLKNAPQIYQRLVDNALYGFFRLPAAEHEAADLYAVGVPDDVHRPSVLGRRSYIDDILIAAESWDDLCEKTSRLLNACDQWNLSISVAKSYWGMPNVDYLGHRVTPNGLEARPKELESLGNLPFPTSLRAMQSFLGSLNYYNRYIEDFAVYATVLYELREVDFHGGSEIDASDGRLERATTAFELLKQKIAATPILRHFDSEKECVAIVYASEWAVAAALVQDHDGTFEPVKFTSRTLKPNELNYSVVEKEVLALLRLLDNCFTMLAGRSVRVLTRHGTLGWLLRSHGLQGRLAQWAALLSPWSLEITRCTGGEDEVLGAISASITPRDQVDEALVRIAPKKHPFRSVQVPIPVINDDEELLVISFDGSAKIKRGDSAYSAIVWQLPEWTVVAGGSRYEQGLTVNEAEYHGLMMALDLAAELGKQRLIVCGDSNLVIRQLRGEIDCKAPGLQLLRGQTLGRLKAWPRFELVHVKREWNKSADLLAGVALQQQRGSTVETDGVREDLTTLNRLDEIITPRSRNYAPRVDAVVTRARARQRRKNIVLDEDVVQRIRTERIVRAQNEEVWIDNLKKFLRGDLGAMAQADVKVCASIADQFEVDESGLLFYIVPTDAAGEDRNSVARLVLPETLHDDVLHHYHTSLEGGHQGIGRTYQRVRCHFYWRGLYRSVQRYVGECVDCETGKGRPTIRGESPGNIGATYPFQIVAMDHIPSLPKSFKGNTELLLWVDLFSGFVVAKASASRTAQTIAESYEECVFRRFGASEAIRHDREPGFMSDFFRAFNKIVGQRQRATLAYRPQANGTAERMVQTLTRAIKMYVSDEAQRDWDEYAERLTFAINTAHDRVRQETPFYLVHGWDPRSTLEVSLPIGSTRRQDQDARRWRFHVQQHYQRARAHVNELLVEARASRAERQNDAVRPHHIEQGSRVWLYLDRIREGYAKKLAHLWHGPFRVADKVSEFAVRLEVAGSDYRVFPIVHVSKLKLVRQYPERPTTALTVDEGSRLDFDEELLPGDSWAQTLEDDEYEVEKISDVRTGRRTRYGRVYREFLVHWKGYDEPTWEDEADLNCGALLHEFLRDRARRGRFGVMQSHDAE